MSASGSRWMDRTCGSQAVPGNALTLQFDGPHTFEAWIEAIAGARKYVHFENYILRDTPPAQRPRNFVTLAAIPAGSKPNLT